MARTDIHSPKNFDPAQYQVVDYFDNKPPEPPRGAALSARGLELYDLARKAYLERIFRYFPEWRSADETADHRGIHQCAHCGHRPIRYVAVVQHTVTGAYLCFGEICADRAELPSRAEWDRKKARRERELAQARVEREVAREAWLAAGGKDIHEWLTHNQGHPFLRDMLDTIERRGQLSPNQLAATQRWMARDAEKAARKVAEREAQGTQHWTAGRQEIEGEIVSVKWKDGAFPGYKMMVKTADGRRAWGSLPAALDPEQATGEDRPDPKGCIVRFAAELQVSNDDPTFGFFKRPQNARVLDARGSSTNQATPPRPLREVEHDLQCAYNDRNHIRRIGSYKPEYGGPSTQAEFARDAADLRAIEADIAKLEAERLEAAKAEGLAVTR